MAKRRALATTSLPKSVSYKASKLRDALIRNPCTPLPKSVSYRSPLAPNAATSKTYLPIASEPVAGDAV